MVFEQASRLRQQGTGLGLWTNAVAELHELWLGEILNGIAEPVQRLVFLSAEGEKLNEIRLDRITRWFFAPSVNVQRSELLSAIAREVGEEIITFSARCAGFEQDADGVAARFVDAANTGRIYSSPRTGQAPRSGMPYTGKT